MVAYASRSLTETEQRYVQIKKEALATTWTCEKFANTIFGTKAVIETDHKPLVPLFSNKHLHALPACILRFRLHLNRFNYAIHHTPGKEMYTGNKLSRAPTAQPGKKCLDFQSELESYIDTIMTLWPASKGKLEQYAFEQYAFAQAKDPCAHNFKILLPRRARET